MENRPFIELLEQEAREQLDEIRQRRINRTEKPEYRQRAKEAIGVIGNYVRLRATLANERSNDLIERRLLGPQRGGEEPPLLPAGVS